MMEHFKQIFCDIECIGGSVSDSLCSGFWTICSNLAIPYQAS